MPLKKTIENDAYKKNLWGYVFIQSFTFLRIPLAILFSVFLTFSQNAGFRLGAALFLLFSIEATDLFDGIIARKYGLVTEYGAALDPYSDSIARLIIYWGLSYNGYLILLVPLTMAIRDITVAYSRIILTRHKYSVSARKSGKIKAWFQAIGSFIALLGPVYWPYTGEWTLYTVSWIIITATLLSSVEYVRDAIRAMRKEK